MSALPPDASNAPQPADNEPDDSATVPRWAVPAVPPPWAGTGQAAPGAQSPAAQPPIAAAPVEPAQAPPPAGPPAWAQPAAAPQQYGQAAWSQAPVAPAVARKPLFDRQKWLPTVVVAGLIAGVVLGGIGLDKVIAAPSAGTVNVGGSVTITAAPGWVLVDNGGDSSSGVVLQKANVRMVVVAQTFDGSAHSLLAATEESLSSETAKIAFSDEQDGQLSGHQVAMAGFEAIDSGSSGGTLDGEVICLIASGNGVMFVVVAAQGDLGQAVDDIKAMVSSVEVGK